MEIASFEGLVAAARQQPEPQRLLFVFAKPVLRKDADEGEIDRFRAGRGGGLQPLMSVDKWPEELTDFPTLAAEADARSGDWRIVFSLGSLGGRTTGSY